MADAKSRAASALVHNHVGDLMGYAKASAYPWKEEVDFNNDSAAMYDEPGVTVQQPLSDLNHPEMLQNTSQGEGGGFRLVR
jgi:hypothetical protein